jgi:signal transduction histidine kinase
VTFSVPHEQVQVAIDRVLMRRVLSNLATNAIQAAGKGKAKLWLTVSFIEATDSIELRLEDNGPGVPQQNAEKIFEPYFTTKSDGTGLGLAIVKKIVLQHGGTITLRKPNLGTGAAFVILLPAPSRVRNVATESDAAFPRSVSELSDPADKVVVEVNAIGPKEA